MATVKFIARTLKQERPEPRRVQRQKLKGSCPHARKKYPIYVYRRIYPFGRKSRSYRTKRRLWGYRCAVCGTKIKQNGQP